MAELVIGGAARLRRVGWSPRAAHGVTGFVVLVLVVRFGAFAENGVRNFRNQTRPFDRFVMAVRRAVPTSSGELHVAPADVEGIDALYRDAAAETALCRPGVRVLVP